MFRKSCVSYQQGGGSELSNNHAPLSKGVFTQQIILCPLQAAPVAALGTHETQLPQSSFVQSCPLRQGDHCVPLTLPRGCGRKQSVEQARLELSAEMEMSIRETPVGSSLRLSS